MTEAHGSLEVSATNRPRSSFSLRYSERWTVRLLKATSDDATTPGQRLVSEHLLNPGLSTLILSVPVGQYAVELRVATGRYVSMAAPALGVALQPVRWLLKHTRYGDLPLPGVPYVVGVETVSVEEGETCSVSMDAGAGSDISRSLRLVANAIDCLVLTVTLACVGGFLLLAADLIRTEWVLLVVGGVPSLLGLALALNAFFSAIAFLPRRAKEVATTASAKPKMMPLDLGFALAAEVLVGLAFMWFMTAGMSLVLDALQGWGLCLAAPACGPVPISDLVEGLLWHAADTVPLVKIGSAWNWEQAWKIQADPPLSLVAGTVPFLVRLVVALGLARFVTQVVKLADP